jgi:hypothetical protein
MTLNSLHQRILSFRFLLGVLLVDPDVLGSILLQVKDQRFRLLRQQVYIFVTVTGRPYVFALRNKSTGLA